VVNLSPLVEVVIGSTVIFVFIAFEAVLNLGLLDALIVPELTQLY
jgi:hypothetical protein